MQKLWIASELFFPEETSTSYILTKIANRLSSKHLVKVVCGKPVYDQKRNSPSFHLDSKVIVHRIKGISGNKNSLVSRSLRFFLLSFAIFFYLLKNSKKGEKVLIVTNPAPLIVLMAVLKKIRHIKLTILVHDVFPENTIPAGIFKSKEHFLYGLLKRIFDFAYSSADDIIVLGRDMQRILQEKTSVSTKQPKITIIENWGDIQAIYPLSKAEVLDHNSPLKDKIVFQYAGNIGRVQGLLELLEVIRQVKNDKIAFYFVGEGAVKTKMKKMVDRYNISNVFFGDAYSREEQQTVLNKSDIAFVSLADGMFGLGVPSKTYNILAAGKPILYIGQQDTEIDLLVREKNIGYSFKNRESLVGFFNRFDEDCLPDLQIKKYNARKVAEESFSEEIILNKFLDII